MNCKLIDSRNQKVYTGRLTTGITVGQPVKVLLADGKHEFHIASIRRCLYVGTKYYLVDGNGIRFTIVLQ
jgi:hypothetical protein